ncbi:hypothetical protein ACFPIJ_42720 [Dactylosporangium cerinum]|uniref:NACHT N-terminal Helical domain-containing protein n=1 Tax=Dactylosporangium cerinum TaxID=1434730 RepID=A0ABV9W731_9ACTN
MTDEHRIADAVRVIEGGRESSLFTWIDAANPGDPDAWSLDIRLFDPENEVIKTLHDLCGAAATRLASADPINRGPLMSATHTVLVVSAFFTELADQEPDAMAIFEQSHASRWPRSIGPRSRCCSACGCWRPPR